MTCVRVFASILLLTAVVGGERVSAQSASRTWDVSAQLSVLRLGEFDALSTGIGGRVTKDLTKAVALDGEFVFVPRDTVSLLNSVGNGQVAGVRYERRRVDGFVGVKAGRRFDRVGIFAKVRPGFSRLTNTGADCTGDVCALMLLAVPDYKTEFAVDLGAVLEFYGSDRLVARVDLGDAFIRHRGQAVPGSSGSSHNFASKFGIGFRF